MVAPSLMFEHRLDILKGWSQLTALDFASKLSANVTFDVPAGRVMHLNAAGEFETGIAGHQMPLFVFQGSQDMDVANPGTTPGGLFMHQAIAPTGVMNSFVATGGFELESTEFNTALTYARNDVLTAAVANATLATGGVLTNAGTGPGGVCTEYYDPLCGVVSRGEYNNSHGVAVLAFWPVWLPPMPLPLRNPQ